MSEEKYRQYTKERFNCKKGHGIGTPPGGSNDGGFAYLNVQFYHI